MIPRGLLLLPVFFVFDSSWRFGVGKGGGRDARRRWVAVNYCFPVADALGLLAGGGVLSHRSE